MSNTENTMNYYSNSSKSFNEILDWLKNKECNLTTFTIELEYCKYPNNFSYPLRHCLTNNEIKSLIEALKINNSIKTLHIKSLNYYTEYFEFKYNKFLTLLINEVLNKEFSKIEELDLTEAFLYEGYYNIIINNLCLLLETNKSITTLNLSNCYLRNIKQIMNSINKNKTLKNINLSNNKLKNIDYIFDLLALNKSIENINLSKNDINNIDKLINLLNTNHTIKKIDLSQNKITSICNKMIPNHFVDAYNSNDGFMLSMIQNNTNNSSSILMKDFINSINNNNTIEKIDLSFNNIYNVNPFYKIKKNKMIFFGNPGLLGYIV